MDRHNYATFDINQHLAQLIEKSPVVVCTWRNDEGWPISYVSANVRQFGYQPEELLSGDLRFADLIHPGDTQRLSEEVTAYIAHGPDTYRQVYRLRHADGHWIWIEDHTWLVRDATGTVTSIEGVLIDCSEERRGELYDSAHVEITSLADDYDEPALIAKLLHYANLLTDSEVSALRLPTADAASDIGIAGTVLTSVADADEPSAIPLTTATRMLPRWDFATGNAEPVICNTHCAEEPVNISRTTAISVHRHLVVPLRRKGLAAGFIAVCNKQSDYLQSDIHLLQKLLDLGWEIIYRRRLEAELTQRNYELESLARADALTGLPNRLVLEERLELAIARGRRHEAKFAVAFLDLDGFKPVNDAYGHPAGDRVLQTLARRFPAVIREGDTVARFGGDEFIFLFLDIKGEADVRELLARVMAAIAEPIAIHHEGDAIEASLSASAGVTFYPQAEDVTGSELLRQADQAMYRAKAERSTSVVIY